MRKLLLILSMVLLIPSVLAYSVITHAPIGTIYGTSGETISVTSDVTLSQGSYTMDSADNWIGMTCNLNVCSNTSDLSGLEEGTHNITYYIDTAAPGPGTITETYYFSIDREPSAPTGIVVQEYNDSALRINWNANPESDIDYYTIYNNETNSFIVLDTTVGTSYIHSGRTQNVEYYYYITASDSLYESDPSAIENGKITSTNGSINITIEDANPIYSNIVEPSDPSTYSPSATYDLTCDWEDDVTISKAILTFGGNNYTGAFISGLTYGYTFGALDAGIYTYKWTANDSANQFNETAEATFTIDKATPVVALSASDFTINEGELSNVSCTATVGTPILNRTALNTTNLTVTNPEELHLSNGSYAYKCYVEEDTNYNYAEDTDTLIVADQSKLFMDIPALQPKPRAAPGSYSVLKFDMILSNGDYVRARMTDLTGAGTIAINESSQPMIFCEEDYNVTTRDYDGTGPIYMVDNNYNTAANALRCNSTFTPEEVGSYNVMLKVPIPSSQVEGSYNGDIYFQMYDTETE